MGMTIKWLSFFQLQEYSNFAIPNPNQIWRLSQSLLSRSFSCMGSDDDNRLPNMTDFRTLQYVLTYIFLLVRHHLYYFFSLLLFSPASVYCISHNEDLSRSDSTNFTEHYLVLSVLKFRLINPDLHRFLYGNPFLQSSFHHQHISLSIWMQCYSCPFKFVSNRDFLLVRLSNSLSCCSYNNQNFCAILCLYS